MRQITFVSAAIYLGALAPACAAGYGLHEFSAQATGMAFAGSSADASDPSFLAYNPATSSGVADADASVGAFGILTGSSAAYGTALTSAGTPTGGNAAPHSFVGSALVPSLNARMRLTDNLTAGLAVYAPWDLATNYPANFSGRYYAETTKLLTANITPSLAWEFSPALVIGAGAQIEYAKGTLSNAVDVGTVGLLNHVPGAVPGAMDATATFTGTNWAFGYTVGALIRPADDMTIGISYTSNVNHDFNGMLRFQPDAAGLTVALRNATGLFQNTSGAADIKVPDEARIGAKMDVAPGWDASLEADWTNWATFKNLTVTTANPVQSPDVTLSNWKSTWMVSGGAQYHPDDIWTFRGGVAFDPTPIPDSTIAPRIPDGNRVIVSLGTSFAMDESNLITFAASHLFVDSRTVTQLPTQTGNALRGALAGTTSGQANVLGLQITSRIN